MGYSWYIYITIYWYLYLDNIKLDGLMVTTYCLMGLTPVDFFDIFRQLDCCSPVGWWWDHSSFFAGDYCVGLVTTSPVFVGYSYSWWKTTVFMVELVYLYLSSMKQSWL